MREREREERGQRGRGVEESSGGDETRGGEKRRGEERGEER